MDEAHKALAEFRRLQPPTRSNRFGTTARTTGPPLPPSGSVSMTRRTNWESRCGLRHAHHFTNDTTPRAVRFIAKTATDFLRHVFDTGVLKITTPLRQVSESYG